MGERASTRATERGADFCRAAIREPEQLIRVPMLLVIVDEPRIGRGCDHASWSGRQLDGARVIVEHIDTHRPSDRRELPNAGGRVGRVAPKELLSLIDGPARSLVLVAVVRLTHWTPREVQVEVRRKPSRPS